MKQFIFLIPIVIVGAAAMVHATQYLHGEATRHLRRFWGFMVATLLSMVAVVLAPNELTFILAWEAMGLTSAGLVAFENEAKAVKKATYIYLLACHAGACALMMAGVFLMRPDCYLAAFSCAIIGFGLKIGFPPFHVWLPEAHPAAPAPASAVMSGAMIPLGFYGLLHFFDLGFSPVSGWTLIGLGIIGALGGILFALPQVNIKKLLAFSSVENMGIIAMGFGLAFLSDNLTAASKTDELVFKLAYFGAIAHILNHAFLKGALFLASGSILRQTGTLNQDQLGGLLRRMPKTGTLFILNALGLSGLPPFNGFLSELLIYLAGFYAVRSDYNSLRIAGFVVITTMALTGGLAVAAYTKVIGATFLGEPRSEAAITAEETPKRMWMAILGLFGASLAMIGVIVYQVQERSVTTAAVLGGLLVLLTAILIAFRRLICPLGKVKTFGPTWDCGYHEPTARMAYTATAFTQPLVELFKVVLRPNQHLIAFKGHPATPSDAALVTETTDLALSRGWNKLFTKGARLFQRAHLLQNGSLHLYILLVIIAVLILLFASLI